MSHDSRQQGFGTFSGEYPHLKRPHLSESPPSTGVKLSADPDKAEAWCEVCNNRVTVGQLEYGHARECVHSVFEADQ